MSSARTRQRKPLRTSSSKTVPFDVPLKAGRVSFLALSARLAWRPACFRKLALLPDNQALALFQEIPVACQYLQSLGHEGWPDLCVDIAGERVLYSNLTSITNAKAGGTGATFQGSTSRDR